MKAKASKTPKFPKIEQYTLYDKSGNHIDCYETMEALTSGMVANLYTEGFVFHEVPYAHIKTDQPIITKV